MTDEMQALCFLAGANSIFYGDQLLTTENPEADADRRLFERLGIRPEPLATDRSDEDEAAELTERVEQERQSHLFYDAANA